MADLIRALESDLFGAYEWAADMYEDLAAAPEAPDRLAVHRGLARAYAGMEERAAEAARAATRMTEMERALTQAERELLAALEAPRAALFDRADLVTATAFLAAFDPAWARGARDALVADALTACLARSNIVASLTKSAQAGTVGHGTFAGATGPTELHRWAAETYEEVGRLLHARMQRGETIWQETAAACTHRAVVAWRMAGEEKRSRTLESSAPPPRGVEPKR